MPHGASSGVCFVLRCEIIRKKKEIFRRETTDAMERGKGNALVTVGDSLGEK